MIGRLPDAARGPLQYDRVARGVRAKAERARIMNKKNAVLWAYLCVFIGVCGHASSEFFAVLSGIKGAEVSVWRYIYPNSLIVLTISVPYYIGESF